MDNFIDCMFHYAMNLLVSKRKFWTEIEPGVWRDLYAEGSDTYGDMLIIKYISAEGNNG